MERNFVTRDFAMRDPVFLFLPNIRRRGDRGKAYRVRSGVETEVLDGSLLEPLVVL